jgi:hypothetical protein
MYDTVAIRFLIPESDMDLNGWDQNPYFSAKKQIINHEYLLQEFSRSGAPIGLIYYPVNPGFKESSLIIQASLPKIHHGNNIQGIETQAELDDAIDMLDAEIKKMKWFPPQNVRDGFLCRVDATHNFQVGPRAQDYIRALFWMPYPERKTCPYLYEGVQWKSKVATLKAYDKFLEEQKKQAAWGLLRLEVTLRHNWYIERRMNITNPTLKDLTVDWAYQTLSQELDRLHLTNTLFCNRELAQEILVNKYGLNKGLGLLAYLIASQSTTREQMIDLGGKGSTIRTWIRLIAAAGIAPGMTDQKVPLPPLIINRQMGINNTGAGIGNVSQMSGSIK